MANWGPTEGQLSRGVRTVLRRDPTICDPPAAGSVLGMLTGADFRATPGIDPGATYAVRPTSAVLHPMGANRWAILGARIRAERSRRWRRREDFAAACGVSPRLIGALENAERTNFTPEMLAAVEATLGWEIGEVSRILKGDSARRTDERMARLVDLWPRLSPDAQRLVVEFAERALPDCQ